MVILMCRFLETFLFNWKIFVGQSFSREFQEHVSPLRSFLIRYMPYAVATEGEFSPAPLCLRVKNSASLGKILIFVPFFFFFFCPFLFWSRGAFNSPGLNFGSDGVHGKQLKTKSFGEKFCSEKGGHKVIQ